MLGDCWGALMGVDWWCGVLNGRWGGGEGVDEVTRSCESHGRTTSISKDDSHVARHAYISSATHAAPASRIQPSTHHPLSHRRFSHTTRTLLLTALDLLMLAILAAHGVTYFVSLPTAIAFCDLPAVLSSPAQELGEDKVPLSVRDRCIGLNVDIHVAGGFAVFMALVLGLLHLAALGLRGWEAVRFGREGVVGQMVKSEWIGLAVGESSALGSRVSYISVSGKSEGQAGGGLQASTSIGAEERSTGIRFVNWSGEGGERTARRRVARSYESEALNGSSNWSEMFLECLVDA